MKITEHFKIALLLFVLCIGSSSLNAQTPTIVNGTPTKGFIGEEQCFPIVFSNTGSVGYGPYIRLILPPGITFNSASFLGNNQSFQNLGSIVGAAPLNYVLDPTISTGAAADTIFAPTGSTVILLKYPVGSLVDGGIDLETELCVQVDASAALFNPVDICVVGVYEYGDSPTGDNGPIVTTGVCAPITPVLYTFDKIGNEGDAVSREPGACHTHTYELNVDIAAAGVLNNTPIVFTDVLPQELQYVGSLSLPPGCVAISEPSLVTPGGNLEVECTGTYSGSTADIDMQVHYDAYIVDVLDEAICDVENATNSATLDVPSYPQETDVTPIETQHLSLVHTNNFPPPTTVVPGQLITYTINFDITEYTAGLTSASIQFEVPDGMLYDQNSIRWNGNPVNPSDVRIGLGAGTGSIVTVDVHAANGGANILPCNAPTLQYAATVAQNYANGDPVLGRDILRHSSSITYNLVEGASNCSASSGTLNLVQDISFSKKILNSPTASNRQWQPGDTITYELSLKIPSKDLNDVVITDFFPLPIHSVADLHTTFGTDVRFSQSSCWTNNPIDYIIDTNANSLAINFGNISDYATQNCVDIVIEIDIPITDIPFADGLFHSNFIQINSDNTTLDDITATDLTLFQVAAPELTLTKGISSSSNARTVITPVTTPVNGNASEVDAGDSLTFQITIENEGGAPGYNAQVRDQVPSTLTNCDLVSTNPVTDGSGTAIPFTGGFSANSLLLNITDSIGFAGISGGNNFVIISYVCEAASNLDLGLSFENTAEVDWSSSPRGNRFPPVKDDAKVNTATPTMQKSVHNIFPGYAANLQQAQIGEVVSYELQVLMPEGEIDNTILTDLLDPGLAFVSVDSIRVATSSGNLNITTSQAGGFNGVLTAAVIDAVGASALEQDRRLTLDFATIQNLETDNILDTLKIYYSTIVVNDVNNQDGVRLTNRANLEWTNPNNVNNTQSTSIRSDAITVIEADLQISKTYSSSDVVPGNNTFVTLTVQNPPTSNATAFDVVLTDLLPVGMTFVSGFSAGGTANITTAPTQGGGLITAQWDTIKPGEIYSITFEVAISSAITPCTTITNCANIIWESVASVDEASMPSAYSTTIGDERTGNSGDPGGAANNYALDSCASLNVVIDNTFDPFITSNAPVCEGERLVLSVQQYNGSVVTYNWTGPGVPSNFNNYELIIDPISSSDTGTYFVFVELDGCITDTSNFYRVDLLPKPNTPNIAPTNATVCEGETVAFSTDSIANNYVWSGPNGFTGNSPNPPLISPVLLADAGIYTVYTFNNLGCTSDPAQSVLTVLQAPPVPSIANNSPICSGENIVLSSASTATTYTWIAPNGSDTTTNSGNLTIDPTDPLYIAGNWTLVVADANGCASQPSLASNVIINQTPVNLIATNSGPICEGESLDLLVTTSSNATYEWYDDINLTNLISTSATPTISGLSAAGSPYTYHVRVIANGCASDTVSTVAVVNARPVIPAPSYSTVCAGDSLFLFANVAARSYVWSGPSGFTSNLENPIIPNSGVSNAGSYSLSITDVNACANQGIVQVAVNNLPNNPVITGNLPTCEGENVRLEVQSYTGNNVTYNWTTPQGSITTAVPSLNINNATIADAGTYSVIVSVDGCNSLIDSVSLMINANPAAATVPTNIAACEGDAVQLTTSTVANTYQWIGPNGFNSTLANPAVITPLTASDTGTYELVITDINGCTAPAATLQLSMNPLPPTPAITGSTVICEGEDIALSTNAVATNYIWTAPNGADTSTTTTALVVNPNSTFYQDGNWSLAIENADGCISAASTMFNIAITTIPAQAIAINNGPVCIGGNVQLSTAPVANATYAWYTDIGLTNLIANQQNPIVTNITTDSTFYLTIEVNGCLSATTSTTVDTLGQIAAPNVPNDTTICVGESFIIGTSTVASRYQWTGPNGFNSNQQNPVALSNLTALDAGTYSLVTYNANGCASTVASFVLSIDPIPNAPVLSSNVAICRGDSLVLSTTAVANSYTWIAPNGATTTTSSNILSIPSNDVFYYQAGNWQLQTQNTGACSSSLSNTVNVVINSASQTPVILNDGPVCIGSSVTLSTVAAANMSYAWFSGASLIATTPTVTVNNITTDSTFYLQTMVNGCISAMGSTTVAALPQAPAPNISADTTICAGESFSLSTTTVAASYQWSGPNGFSSTLANPPAIVNASTLDAGIYTLAVTYANGCVSADATVTITVNAAPHQPTITTNSPLCFGDTIQMQSSSNCGQAQWIGPAGNSVRTLGTAGNSVLWTIGSATSIPPTSPYYLSGQYQMLCIDTLTGCSSISNPVTVEILPSPIISAFNGGAICANNNATLHATFISGASYKWYTDSTLTTMVSTDRSPTILNLDTTTTFYVVANLNGCTSNIAQTTVIVQPNPLNPTPSFDPLCSFDTLFLFANTTAFNYWWEGPNGFVSNLQNPNIPNTNSANAGSYVLTVQDSSGCEAIGVVEVDIYPKPLTPTILHDAPKCVGEAITLYTQPQYGVNVDYVWYLPSGATDTTDVPILTINNTTFADTGVYRLVVWVDGCFSLPAQEVINLYPIPSTPVVPADFTVCEGDDVILTTTTNAFAYYWTGSNGFQSNLPSPTVVAATPVDAGAYSLFVENQYGCRSEDSSVYVTVNSLPAEPTIVSNSPLCEGDTLFLSSSSNCGQAQWVGPAGNSTGTLGNLGNSTLWTIGSNTAIPVTDPHYLAGDWYMICIDTLTGCQSISNTIGIEIKDVPATPVAFNNGSVCSGESANLTTATVAGASYEWYADVALTQLVANVQNPTIANIVTDSTFYLVIEVNGCRSLAGSTTVIVRPAPAAPDVPANFEVCEGGAIVLTTTTSATAYYWTGPNGFSSNLASPTVVSATTVDAGVYSLYVVDANGCRSVDSTLTVTVNSNPSTPILTNNGAICEGDDLVLQTTATANSYIWIAPNGDTTVTNSDSLSIRSTASNYLAGNWNLQIIDTNTCSSDTSNNSMVVINSIPTNQAIFNDGPVCMGENANVITSFVNGATYSWYGDAALTNLVSNAQNPTLTNLRGDSTIYLAITINGCTNLVDSTTIMVHPVPAAPNLAANFDVCEGADIVLNTTTVASTYIWTGPNGFSSNLQQPTAISSASTLDEGVYSLTIVDANGCVSPDTNVVVTVLPQPNTPLATNTSPVCVGQSVDLIANGNFGGTATFEWFDATTASSIGNGQTLALTNVTAASAGDYYVIVTENGCTSEPSSNTSIVINDISTTTAYAGIDLALCDQYNTTLNATATAFGSGFWTTTGSATIVNPIDPQTTVSNLAVGNNVFYWTLSNGACLNYSTDSIIVNVTAPSSEFADAGLDTSYCGLSPVRLSANTVSLSTGRWTQSAAQASQGVVIDDPLNPNTRILGTQAGNVYVFSWTLSNGNCGNYSTDNVSITINASPTDMAYAGVDQNLCNSTTTTLAANASSFGTGFWTTNGAGTIIDPTNPNTIVTNLQDTMVFYWTLSNGSCLNYSVDSVTIIASTATAVADAGVNQTFCGSSNVYLSATAPPVGLGTWIQTPQQAAQGVIIADPNDPNSQVVGTTAGTTYSFTWSLTNGVCQDYSTDITTITITTAPPDNAFAGTDINICGTSTNTTLTASTPASATGFWTTTSTATIVNPTSVSTTVTNLPVGTSAFIWTLSSGSCVDYDSDTVVVTVTAASADIAEAGLDTAYCNQSSVNLYGNAPSVGIGTWTQSANQASQGVVIADPNDPNTAISGLTAGVVHYFDWTFTNGGCVDYSTNQVAITIDLLPSNVAYAGEDTTLCGGNILGVNATHPPIGTGMWTTNNNATIVDPALFNSQIIDILEDTTVYYWTLTNGACRDYSTDSIIVILTQASTDNANAGLDQTLCVEDSIVLSATPPLNSTGVWTQSSAQSSQGVVIVDPTDPNTTVTGIQAGNTYTFTWVLSTVGCPNFSTDEVNYIINAVPTEVAYAGTDIYLCDDSTTNMNAIVPTQSTGFWTVNNPNVVLVNPALPTTDVVNLPIGTTAFVWTLSNGSCTDYSTDTMYITVAPTSVDAANAGLDIAICDTNAVTLDALRPTIATGRWVQTAMQASLGVVIANDTLVNTNITGLVPGNSYEFEWILSSGACTDYDRDVVVITVNTLPTDNAYAGEDLVYCSTEILTLSATEPTRGTGQWTTTSTATIVTPSEATTEIITLEDGLNAFYWSLSNGACANYSVDTLYITLDDAPVANNDSFVVFYNATIDPINVITNDSLIPDWELTVLTQPTNGSITDLGDGLLGVYSQDVLATQSFTYQLCNPGCPDIFCDTAKVVLVIEGGLECNVPNVFTPNEDGVNDRLIVPCLTNYPNAHLLVFNRWGDKVYENENYQNTWEGTYNNQPLPDGTYFYVLKVDENTELQGFIELRR